MDLKGPSSVCIKFCSEATVTEFGWCHAGMDALFQTPPGEEPPSLSLDSTERGFDRVLW